MKVSIRVGFRAADPANPLDAVVADCEQVGDDSHCRFEVPRDRARGATADRRRVVRGS
jgi:hypothetical protein